MMSFVIDVAICDEKDNITKTFDHKRLFKYTQPNNTEHEELRIDSHDGKSTHQKIFYRGILASSCLFVNLIRNS